MLGMLFPPLIDWIVVGEDIVRPLLYDRPGKYGRTMCAPTERPLGAPKASLVKGRGTAAEGGGGGIPYYRSISNFRNPPAPPGHPPLARGALLRGSLPHPPLAPPLGELSAVRLTERAAPPGTPSGRSAATSPIKGGGFFAPNYCGQPLKIVRFHTFNGNGGSARPFSGIKKARPWIQERALAYPMETKSFET